MKNFTLLALLFLFSCSEKKETTNLKTYYPLEMCSEYNGVDDNVDLEIIQLQCDSAVMLREVSKIILVDSLLIITDKENVLSFSKDGNYLGNYGDKGKATNEYQNITDIAVSFDQTELYIYCHLHYILIYDLNSRRFVNRINLNCEKSYPQYMGIAPAFGDCFYLYETHGFSEEELLPRLIKYNREGKMISEHLLTKDILKGWNPITPTSGNRYFTTHLAEDKICYELCKDSLLPKASFAIDFKEKHIPLRYGFSSIPTSQEEAMAQLERYHRSDYFKVINTPLDNENYLMFNAIGAENYRYKFIINKNNDQGVYLKSSNIDFLTSDNEWFYGGLPVVFGKSPFDKMVEKKVSEMGLSEEDSYLLKCKFKF